MADRSTLVLQITAAQKGDGEAFASLVEPFEARLYQLALGITGNHEDAEDAWQNALLRAWKSIGRVKDSEAFRSWISRIVVNECRRVLRSRISRGISGGRSRAVSIPDGEHQVALGLDGSVDGEAMGATQDVTHEVVDQMAVLSHLQALPQEQRETLLLRFWLDMPLQDVARVTGVPLSTAKSRLYRGLEALEPLLKREGFGHGGSSR
jgi:RNA polymerase sigma-70 factor (ECF subfamily)